MFYAYVQTIFQLHSDGMVFSLRDKKQLLMKGFMVSALALCMITGATAQNTPEHKDNLNSRTSWLKAGVSAGIPVGNTAAYSSFTAGAIVNAQMMANPHLGLGLTSGYSHYFGKNGGQDFGAIPLGALVRYYAHEPGLLAGTDLGYTFTTNIPGSTGGFYVKPQLGWNNYDWNIYGFYNHVFANKGIGDLQSLGLAVTYNIRFN
jgi:hypothetical protein